MDKVILDLCGGTGSWSKPYKESGYDVRVFTLPDYDIREYNPPDNVYGILAAPPCTEFSVVKNHTLERDIPSALKMVDACMQIILQKIPVFWALENPVGFLKKYLGKPAYSFQPWFFGDAWTKRTLLWGRFNIPKEIYTKWEDVPKLPGLYVRPGRGTPSIAFNHVGHKKFIPQLKDFNVKTDAEFRAITAPGFAKAFFEANQ